MTIGGQMISFPTPGMVPGSGTDTGTCLILTGITGIGIPVPGIVTSGIMIGVTTPGTIHRTTICGLIPEYGGYTRMNTIITMGITILTTGSTPGKIYAGLPRKM